MKDPVDHILRPCLPWREVSMVTECGYNAKKVQTISREEFLERLGDYGEQRTAMLTCMTCSSTAKRWGAWNDDPRQAIEREVNWENPRIRDRGTALLEDLKAIAALIASHPDEFKELVGKARWVNRKESRNVQKNVPHL